MNQPDHTHVAQSPLEVVRRKALDLLMGLSAVIGSVLMFVLLLTFDTFEANRWLLVLLCFLQGIQVLATLLSRFLPFKLLAAYFIFYAFMLSTSVLWVGGPLPAPFLSMSVALLASGLFFGRRLALVALGVSALIFSSVAIGHLLGLTHLPGSGDLDLSIAKNVGRIFGVSFGLLAVMTLLVSYLLDKVEETMAALRQEIIERRLAEDKQLMAERALQRAQKMEALGQLSGSVAHDFNNALAVIQVWNDMLKTSDDEDEEDDPEILMDATEGIQQAVDTAAGLTRRLLEFASREVQTGRVCEPGQVLRDNLPALRSLMPEDVALQTQISTDALIPISATELQQIFFNLALNARDAMPIGGRFTFTVRLVEQPTTSSVIIEALDTGVGIAPDVLERIVEPFFTTKPKGKGTGLGLASVYGIVRGAQGGMSIKSTLGNGSRFTLTFPLAESDADVLEASIQAPRAASPRRSGATVLVAEDEAPLLATMVRLLENAGYKVLAAKDGLEALELSQKHTIDMLCTDAIMPNLGAVGLLEQFEVMWPDVPVLVCSAHIDELLLRRGLSEGRHRFLQKPFAADDLLNHIDEALALRDAATPSQAESAS